MRVGARELDTRRARVTELRDYFQQGLEQLFGEQLRLNGHPTERLPNTLNVSFVGQLGSEVLTKLEGVAASTGSACHSGRQELSPVLRAMGVPEAIGLGAVRFSLGRWTTREELHHVLGLFRAEVLPGKMRHGSSGSK